MPEFRPYSSLPKWVHPLIQGLVDEHHDLVAMAILPRGDESLQCDMDLEKNQFSGFDWAQYIFCDLQNPGEIRGFLCDNKVCLLWPDQVTLAAGGRAVF